jgi:hypothetical protein
MKRLHYQGSGADVIWEHQWTIEKHVFGPNWHKLYWAISN